MSAIPGAKIATLSERTALYILLVEDSPADIRLTREALDQTRHPYQLEVANDGAEALQLLRDKANNGSPQPDLILLDWNLPRKDGREVLRELKQDSLLKVIPVVVLTTSRAESDIQSAYELQANCFITKPVDVIQFFRVIRDLEEFWFGTATLPK